MTRMLVGHTITITTITITITITISLTSPSPSPPSSHHHHRFVVYQCQSQSLGDKTVCPSFIPSPSHIRSPDSSPPFWIGARFSLLFRSMAIITITTTISFVSCRVDGVPLETLFGAVSSEALDLLRGLLAFDPLTRLSAEQALQHAYFSTGPDATPPHLLPKLSEKKT